MATHKVVYDFKGNGKDQLLVKAGDLVTVLNEMANGWSWVKNLSGKEGSIPSSYIEAILVKDDKNSTPRGSIYEAKHAYTAKDSRQLSIQIGDRLELLSKLTNDWWSMRNVKSHGEGIVPSSYISACDVGSSSQPVKDDDESLSEVLMSIDSNIERLHNEAKVTGMYTHEQRTILQTLIAHRESVIKDNSKKSNSPHRQAPPPPSVATVTSASAEPLDLANVQMRNKVSSGQNRPKSEIIPKRTAPPPPPARKESLSPSAKKEPEVIREESESSHSSDNELGEAVSPNTKRRVASYLNKIGASLETVEEMNLLEVERKIELPTEFSTEMALELVDVVRNNSGLSHPKSALTVEAVLRFLESSIPTIAPVMDGLLSALHSSQSTDEGAGAEGTSLEGNKDLIRLQEIFFEMQEARDDSQQRGWAIRDDSEAISELLEELIQILFDADANISKAAIRADKYENILTLVSYYQLEHRVALRLQLLRVFGVCCTLDPEVISVLLQTTLPNELGHDIQVNIDENQKAVLSTNVCIMMFSTGEDVPLPVYDQWNLDYVKFILDTIEDPPDSDVEDEIPDVFLNVLLSFNQHFEYPSTNLLMQALQSSSNPRVFSEKLMLLVNRGEDPVAIDLMSPRCPDSLTKILLDIFSDKATSGIFYTTDLMVLIDIISRQLHDLSPGDKNRSHYIELLQRLLGSTDYSDHNHRRDDITTCLSRILKEEEEESREDQASIRQLLQTYPGVFST